MAGVIAAILDPASLEDAESFRADVLAVVFPAAISQAVRQLGIRAGEQMTKNFIRRTMEKEGIETVVKLAGRFMGARFTGKAIATKGVPLVGAGIGAGWNWLEVSAVGKRAIAYHTGQPMTAGKLSDWGTRLIPHRFRNQAP